MKAISGIGAGLLALLASPAVIGQAPPGKATTPATAVHAAEAAPTQPNAAQLKAGEATYKAACLACHQPDGKGLPGAFPPLAGSDYMLKDKARAISTVVHGKTGPITVNGKKFDSVMPPMSQLSDAEIAAALTYASHSWGNKGWLVSATDVKAVRAGIPGRRARN
jgi:mono/diheme cytochrome c family protein